MKYSSLITSATGIALALATVAPGLALAHDGTDDATVQASASVQVNDDSQSGNQGQGERKGFLANIFKPKFMASTTAHVEKPEKEHSNVGSTTPKGDKQGEHMDKVQAKAGTSIDARIKSLTELKARLASIKLLPADQLAAISASIDAEIKILTDLKAKIGDDMATTTLKADVDSITKANRVYLLVEPKARIAASASRINAVVTQMQLLAAKLQTRITDAHTAGIDVTSSNAALADFNAKVADAKVQADAAVTMTANLQVDNGDKTVLAANLAALKAARTKLQAAEADLKTARKDVKTITDAIKVHVSGNASTTVETH